MGKKIKSSIPMKEIKAEIDNPLSELISDEIYELLSSHGLIDEKSVRDFQIRKKFQQLRDSKVSSGDALVAIKEYYPYLQFETIRKIIYQTKTPISKKIINLE
jgi:hypothetical protein